VWHIHGGKPPRPEGIPGFNLLLNLAGVANTDDPKVLWGFITRYMPEFSPATHPFLDQLVKGAVHYYIDFIKPTKTFRLPTEVETQALAELAKYLESVSDETSAEDLQTEVYEIGKRHFDKAELKNWFGAMYETLLGQKQGPRMGSFIKLYGKDNTARLIRRVLAKENLAA
jgi:lysyl-tRNA synthetase class 1